MTVLDWLLDSDPAIRWQVLRDLAQAPAEVDMTDALAQAALVRYPATLSRSCPAPASAPIPSWNRAG
jgi:hypothetical protein